MEWINKIHQGNTLELLRKMPDDFVDMVITSPPYWGLRDYGEETVTIWGGDKDCVHNWLADTCSRCGAWKGQLGLEPHPNMFINNLVEIFREVRRVIKPTGSFYLNMGDTYFGGNMCVGQPKDWKSISTINREKYDSSTMDDFIKKRNKLKSNWLQPKQLTLIPSRVAVAMQEDGWILRNDIIWHKPNPMPSSVKDRLNNTYEHVFHFVKKRKYYYDLDSIRVPHKVDSIKRACRGRHSSKLDSGQYAISYKEDYQGYDNMEEKLGDGKLRAVHALGKNPGDVITKREMLLDTGMVRNGGKGSTLGEPDKWNTLGKNPGDVAILKSWGTDANLEYHGDGKHNPKGQSPSDLKRNIIDSFKDNPKGKNPGDFWDICTQPFSEAHFAVFPEELIKGPIKSSCPEDGIVMDIFSGSGTTCLVAKKMGRNYIGLEMNPEYVEMAKKRLDDMPTITDYMKTGKTISLDDLTDLF